MNEYKHPKLDGGKRDAFNLDARSRREEEDHKRQRDVITKMKAKRAAEELEEKKAESEMRMIRMRFAQAITDGKLDVIGDMADMYNGLADTVMPITINGNPNQNMRPVMAAVAMGRVDILRCLLDHKAEGDFEYRINAACSTPATLAASHGYDDMLHALHSHGVPMDKENSNGKTPLFSAAQHGKVETVRVLIELGANVLYQSPHGMNFMTAIQHWKDQEPELVQIYDQAQKARFDALATQGAPMRVKLMPKIKIK